MSAAIARNSALIKTSRQLDRVLAVLGSIDLDPCAASAEPDNVAAQTCIAKPNDGLKANWTGNVFLNPPYGRVVDDWCEKLIGEWKDAHVTSAIALVAARTDTQWFRMFHFAPVCFINGRLKFRRPGKAEEESAPFPSAVFYLGAEKKRFINAFAQLGEIRDAAVVVGG